MVGTWTGWRSADSEGCRKLNLDRLGRFNILLGANDVGKTSVLEAVFLLTGFVNLRLPIQVSGLEEPAHKHVRPPRGPIS